MALTIVFGVILGVLVVIGCLVAFLFFRGYGKIKGKELDGAYLYFIFLVIGCFSMPRACSRVPNL